MRSLCIYINGISVKNQDVAQYFVDFFTKGAITMLYTTRIRALRDDHDLNQTQVANAIHVAQTTYSDYEKGKVRIPVECLIELAKFYNVDMNYITGVSDVANCFPVK